MTDDPYSILGVSKNSTDAEIKRSYRKLARQYHPDRNPGDAAAEERFKAIQSSYEKIGTAESRNEFDQNKRMEEMFSGGGNSSQFGRGFGGVDIGDIFSQFMGGRSSSRRRESNFDGKRNRKDVKSKIHRGADIESGLDISLEQAINGTELEFKHRRLKRCSKCNGSSFGSSTACHSCNGSGVVTKGSTITVKVPPNAEHGQQLRLKGMGHEHPEGESGDLTITLRLDAKDGRRWEDGLLIQEVKIPFSKLILGGKVRISTPSGKLVQVEIPKGTKIGDRRRIQGQGYNGGSLDIEFNLEEPEELTKKQQLAIKKLRDSGL
tara:strand:- start:3241 stop:4203 length:963 start_codon:yes stop_codon:yes gene_type:complete